MLLSDDQLKKILLDNKLVDEKKLKETETYAKNSNVIFSEALIESNVVTDEILGATIANFLKIPFVNLAKTQVPEDTFHIIPERIARRQKVVAFARDEHGKACNGRSDKYPGSGNGC